MFDASEFTKYSGLEVKSGSLGSGLTTIKIGGPIKNLIDVATLGQVQTAIRFMKRNDVEYRVIGAGSNLLIPDEGVMHPVLRLGGEMMKLTLLKNIVTVGAAASMMRASRDMCGAGLSGLQFAGGIPGTFGGAIRMNAGAHGNDMSALVESVLVVNEDGGIQTLTKDEIKFDYRKTGLRPGQVIIEAKLKLREGDPEQISKERAIFLEHRKATQPLQVPSCGSIFKNPLIESAGSMLEKAGFKGFRCGGAVISEMHANWIVNPDRRAKAVEVNLLIEHCQKVIKKTRNINLVAELVRW